MQSHLYRIESVKTGIGPYQSMIGKPYQMSLCSHLNNEFNLDLYSPSKCPAPNDDGIKSRPSGLRFGFQDLKQLVDWFSNWPEVIETFRKHRFRISRYTVEGDRMDGQKQSCAHLEHLKDRKTIPWKELSKY